jgi:hypothetical protein
MGWQLALMIKLPHVLVGTILLALTGCSCLPGSSAQQGLSVQRDQPSQIISNDEIPSTNGG